MFHMLRSSDQKTYFSGMPLISQLHSVCSPDRMHDDEVVRSLFTQILVNHPHQHLDPYYSLVPAAFACTKFCELYHLSNYMVGQVGM
jgi:hypothetical protein